MFMTAVLIELLAAPVYHNKVTSQCYAGDKQFYIFVSLENPTSLNAFIICLTNIMYLMYLLYFSVTTVNVVFCGLKSVYGRVQSH